MKEIKLTPEELKASIDTGKFVGEGSEGCLFTYKGRIIKLDSVLYGHLKGNHPVFAHDNIKDHFRYRTKDFNDREQLEQLAKRQSKIRPRVPEGIITIKDPDSAINDRSPGILITPFLDYEMIGKVPIEDQKRLLVLLKKVYNDIRELADNEIAHEDLFDARPRGINNPDYNHYNILQRKYDSQIIDLSGQFIKVGKDFTGPNKMYLDIANLINYYRKLYNLEPLYVKDKKITEDKLRIMLNEFEKEIKSKR